jgi:flagellar basal-body rod protein FlgF
MNNGMYAACAGLVARSQALELAANNLANINTTAYKAQVPTFRSVLAQTAVASASSPGAIQQAVTNFGVVGGSRTNLVQGTLEHTGNDLDFALQGEGWFTVQAPGGTLYTRNGNFHADTKGQLVTAEGYSVIGSNGPITVPPGKVSVSDDGTLSVDGGLAGQLKLATFAAGTELTALGSSYFSVPEGAPAVPAPATVAQGSLENSNVNGITAAVGLVSLQRQADFMQQALTTFHSNFNRIAAQDLPRIS